MQETNSIESSRLADSEKENTPPPTRKQPTQMISVFNRGKMTVTREPNPELFKGMVFFLEIFSEGQAEDTYFQKEIISHGGKLSRRLGKHVTHLVWSQGRPKTLVKAREYEGIKIVSTLWLQVAFNEMKVADENTFKPIGMEQIVAKEAQKEMQSLGRGLTKSANILNKRRTQADPTQIKLYERPQEESNLGVRQDANSQNTLAIQPNQISKEQDNLDEELVGFDVERAVKRMKDERTFQKEFAKDMRKLAKIKTMKTPEGAENFEEEKEVFASMLSKKRNGAGELLDKFVDGDLSIDDYMAQMSLKTYKISKGVKRGYNQNNKTAVVSSKGMLRLTEFFKNPQVHESNKKDDDELPKPTLGAKMCLNDILAELDEPASEKSREDEETKIVQASLSKEFQTKHQTNLRVFVRKSYSKSKMNELQILNERPFLAQLDASPDIRAPKSNTKRPRSVLKSPNWSEAEESESGSLGSSEQSNEKRLAQSKASRRAKSQQRIEAIKKTKVKKNPMRGCKIGVSYADIESNNEEVSSIN